MESFNLEKKPKDPMMFYEINNEYFYLIHKWGNDLNVFRAIMPLFSNGYFCWLFIPLVFALMFLVNTKAGLISVIISFIISSVIQFCFHMEDDTPFVFVKKNNWDSE